MNFMQINKKKEYDAVAEVKGNEENERINGKVYFKQTKDGVLVTAVIYGLPTSKINCQNNFLGFHIHEGNSCTGNEMDEFANAKTHYNPKTCMHPHHAGDLPPLLENNGNAYMTVLTNRFNIEEIIGKVVIIHDKPDDFVTQPSGNSGTKIACGEIKKM